MCSLISQGVHLVLSLTACSTAEYLESEAYRYHLPHVAIPRPACEEKQTTKVTETTTIWIQTDPFRMAKAFLEISEMERASHALILADGLTGILIFTHKSYKATLLLNIYYLNHFTSTINDTLTSFLLELYQVT